MVHLHISVSFAALNLSELYVVLSYHLTVTPSLYYKDFYYIAQVSPSHWPFACWDCGFESRRGHGSLSLVIVVFCQGEISASSGTLVQRSPTECGVSEYKREASIMRWPWPTGVVVPLGKMVQADIHFLYCT
jgi:hypothetical protein